MALADEKLRTGKCLTKTRLNDPYYEPPTRGADSVAPMPIEKIIDEIQADASRKEEYLNIYVSNLIDEAPAKPGEKAIGKQRAGTYADPFAQLADALMRAKELVAPFKDKVEVNIHMLKGDHYIVENRYDALNIYIPKFAADDLFSLNLDLTIKPLSCGHKVFGTQKVDPSICVSDKKEQVTVYNKIRERLDIKVFEKTRIENIVFDSVDSILPFGTKCLSERR